MPDNDRAPATEDVEAGRIQGVCFLLVRGDSVLMERCPKKAARHGGEWFIPGGRIEEGETAERALCREVAEELGVSVNGYETLPLADATGGVLWGTFLMRPYRLLAWTGELPDHCRDQPDVPLRWVPLTEALVSPVHAVRAMVAMLPETAAGMSAPRSLSMLESYFRAMSRNGRAIRLTPAQCERIADEIREDLIRMAPPAEDYPYPKATREGAA